MVSSVPAFFRIPRDLFEYQPYYAEFKIMLSSFEISSTVASKQIKNSA
jgi:hypothetical protein